MSGLKYQTLLGESSLDADSIVVENLGAEKGAIGSLDVTKDLYVEGTTEVNEFIAAKASITELTLPMGASEGYILTSVDATGLAAWKPPNNTLVGDITGPIGANVQAHKWIGNWDTVVDYQKFNRVTHNHVEYRALFDNVGSALNTEIGSYSLYNAEYPAPEPSTLAPDSLHQEIALRFEPNQGGFLTHFKFYNISLATVDIKIYTSPGWTIVHEQTSAVGLSWQTIELTVPIKVNARQSVLAAMRTHGQPYAYLPQDFDVLLNMDPAVYVGNDATSTESVFWHANQVIRRLQVTHL